MKIDIKIFTENGGPLGNFQTNEGALMGPTVGHPFWGHTLHPFKGSNNLGLDDENDFPKKNTRIFRIWCIWWFSSAGHSTILKNVSFKFNNSEMWNYKKIRFTNYALGLYCQPQQYNVFHNLYESVDIALNIDGHNEIILPVLASSNTFAALVFIDGGHGWQPYL